MRALSVLLAVAILGTACRSPSTTTLSEAHAAAMRDSVASFLSTWSVGGGERGWDSLVGRYADEVDFLWVEDGRVAYTSVEEVRAAVEGLKTSFAGEETEFLEPSITPLAPGLANVTSRFRTTLRREGASDVRYGGAMTMTALHTGEGWKVLQGHTSTAGQGR